MLPKVSLLNQSLSATQTQFGCIVGRRVIVHRVWSLRKWLFVIKMLHSHLYSIPSVNPGDKFAAFQAAANASSSSTAASAASTTSDVAATTPSVVTVTETLTVSDGGAVTTTYGSYPGSAEPTSASSTNHQVVVGGANLVYNPSNITAQVCSSDYMLSTTSDFRS